MAVFKCCGLGAGVPLTLHVPLPRGTHKHSQSARGAPPPPPPPHRSQPHSTLTSPRPRFPAHGPSSGLATGLGFSSGPPHPAPRLPVPRTQDRETSLGVASAHSLAITPVLLRGVHSPVGLTAETGSEWAGRVFRHFPVFTSHILTLSSN